MDEELLRRLEEARRQSQQAALGFVYAEFAVCLTSLRIAKSRKAIGLEISAPKQLAESALASGEKLMWRFRLEHHEFNQMVATAERIRFELKALQAEKSEGKTE